MDSAILSEQFKEYEQLPLQQGAIVDVLAVYYGYAGPTLIGKCLFDLGFKEKDGKAFKPATLAPLLEALQNLRLVE